jgi:hypothetical protein
VLLDPLREYSKNGVLLKCFDDRGQRIERRFFPFVLYSVSDIEEDWMHGCITGIFTHPRISPRPAISSEGVRHGLNHRRGGQRRLRAQE